MPFPPIDTGEVEELLQVLNPYKAAGPDGIHPAILQPLASIIAAPVTALYNHSLAEGRIPEDWSVAEVVPIFKGGNEEPVWQLTASELALSGA